MINTASMVSKIQWTLHISPQEFVKNTGVLIGVSTIARFWFLSGATMISDNKCARIESPGLLGLPTTRISITRKKFKCSRDVAKRQPNYAMQLQKFSVAWFFFVFNAFFFMQCLLEINFIFVCTQFVFCKQWKFQIFKIRSIFEANETINWVLLDIFHYLIWAFYIKKVIRLNLRLT